MVINNRNDTDPKPINKYRFKYEKVSYSKGISEVSEKALTTCSTVDNVMVTVAERAGSPLPWQ
uniref:Uncharacterized protein n=1 Tax=Anguilla anguilla TaxID=7936 RepID=A0A0E9WME3_ANGAN